MPHAEPHPAAAGGRLSGRGRGRLQVVDHAPTTCGRSTRSAGPDRARVQRPVQRLPQLGQHARAVCSRRSRSRPRRSCPTRLATAASARCSRPGSRTAERRRQALQALYEQAAPPLQAVRPGAGRDGHPRRARCGRGPSAPAGRPRTPADGAGRLMCPAPDEVLVYREYAACPADRPAPARAAGGGGVQDRPRRPGRDPAHRWTCRPGRTSKSADHRPRRCSSPARFG